MNRDKLIALMELASKEIGEEELVNELKKLVSSKSDINGDTLTIIVNTGVHHLPTKLLRGQVFKASEGALDFSNQQSIEQEFARVIRNVAIKLKEQEWKKIYLVPFGPVNLSMLIKLLVYRVIHIETVDIFYIGGDYWEIDMQLRPLIVDAK